MLASGLLLTNIYNSLVDARSWSFSFPVSVETARMYYKNVNPGDFYRLFSPVNQVLALLCVIFAWRSGKKARLFLVAALLVFVLADIFTFAYFYPRNSIIFKAGIADNAAAIQKALQEWSAANWGRSALVLAGIICSAAGLNAVYGKEAAPVQQHSTR